MFFIKTTKGSLKHAQIYLKTKPKKAKKNKTNQQKSSMKFKNCTEIENEKAKMKKTC